MAILLAQIAQGGEPKTQASSADPLIEAAGILFLLAPVICPVLYYWVVPSDKQLFDRRYVPRPTSSEPRRWALTGLVVAGAFAVLGLASAHGCLTILGVGAGVVLGIIAIWSK